MGRSASWQSGSANGAVTASSVALPESLGKSIGAVAQKDYSVGKVVADHERVVRDQRVVRPVPVLAKSILSMSRDGHPTRLLPLPAPAQEDNFTPIDAQQMQDEV